MSEENPVADILGRKAVDEDELEDFEFEKDTSPEYITATVGRVAKARRYISNPSEAPEGKEEEKGTHPMNPEAREAAAELADALDDDCDAEEIIDAIQNRRQAEEYEDE